MNLKTAVVSFAYSIGQIAVGLLIHPYQTMQSLVKQQIFVVMTLIPSVLLSCVTVMWKVLVVPLVQIIFSCSETGFFLCNWLSFVSNTIVFFCVYWQVLLLYLLVRFRSAYKE